jgi:2-keto-3-deoxy-L-rhamnonate aldolase RhmA
MRDNPLKAKLARGEQAVGLISFEFASTGVGRLAAAAGAEFVMFDMEHTGWGIDTIRGVLAASRAAGIVPLVRVPDASRRSVSPVLDLGALGVMVPMVESAQQARDLVAHGRYPPLGSRGVGVYYPDDVEADGLPATLAKANREVLLIAQIETVAGVDAIDEIVAVDGVDMLWIGHFDLTTSLGTPGAFNSPAHAAATERVLSAAKRRGLPVGTLANDVPDGRALLAAGYAAVVFGDTLVFTAGLRDALRALRAE